MIHKQMKAVLDSQEKLIEDLQKNIEVARGKKDKARGEPSLDMAIQLKERHLEVMRGKHEAQAVSLERLKRAVEQHSVEIEKLETEIAYDRKQFEKARKRTAPGDEPVKSVRGVGKVLAGKLEKAKIRTVSDMARAAQKRVASTLGISEERAKTLILEAKKQRDG